MRNWLDNSVVADDLLHLPFVCFSFVCLRFVCFGLNCLLRVCFVFNLTGCVCFDCLRLFILDVA